MAAAGEAASVGANARDAVSRETLLETAATTQLTAADEDEPVFPEVEPQPVRAAAAPDRTAADVEQLSLFAEPEETKPKRSAKEEKFLEQLRKVDLMNMTPLAAMQWIYEMKTKLAE